MLLACVERVRSWRVKTKEKKKKKKITKEVKSFGTTWLKIRNSNNDKILEDQRTTLNKWGKIG
jgi:hypothetical protein